MTIRERVKALCEASDISVNKFEQQMGFSKGYVSKLDGSMPNSRHVKAMADYFHVSTDYILYGDPTENLEGIDFSEVEKILVEYYRKLSSVDQGYIMGYMVGALQRGKIDDDRSKDKE